MSDYFPPLGRVPSPPPSNDSALAFALVSEISGWVAFALLVFDWISFFPKEVRVVWSGRRGWWQTIKPGKHTIGRWFLASRYIALVQGGYFVLTAELGKMSPDACEATRGLPYGFTLAHLPAQFVMILRVWGLCGQSSQILAWLVVGWVLEVGVQFGVNGFVQPVYLALATSPSHHVCYLAPSSTIFALTFIAPSVLSHVILLISLYKSWQHVQAEKVLGTSVVRIFRRDQIFFVLAICLVNFINVVLVLQQDQKAYRLIFYLPSLSLTHILLARVFFSLASHADQPHSSPLHLPLGFDDTTELDRPSFVRPKSAVLLPAASAGTGSHTLDVSAHVAPGGGQASDQGSSTKGCELGRTLSKQSGGTAGSVYSRGGGARCRMAERELMELRAAYPHRPSVGTPRGSISISPAQASPAQRSPVSASSREGSKSSTEHGTTDLSSGWSSRVALERPSHPTPERASTLPAVPSTVAFSDAVPPALRTAVQAKRPSVQRLSRVPVPSFDGSQPAQQAERVGSRYFNHHLAEPEGSGGEEGRAEYRFIPPRRDGVGGERPRFVPVRPARFKSGDEGVARLGAEGAVGSAVWTAEMYG